MLSLVIAAKLCFEIALFALAGQWLLGRLAGASRQHNPFYRLLELLGRPPVSLLRRVLAGSALQRHAPLLAFAALLACWTGAALLKLGYCLNALELCR